MQRCTTGSHTLSEIVRIASVGDLSDDAVDAVLGRAAEFANGTRVRPLDAIIGTVFLTSSLRTRVGFSVAGMRLGCRVVDSSEQRYTTSMSAAESIEDTLRTVGGMVDVLVARLPVEFDSGLLDAAGRRVINAGDSRDHPSQALIDFFAIERLLGPVADQNVVICGDLTMRACRSLLELLSRRPPKSLKLVGPEARLAHGVVLSPSLQSRTTHSTTFDVAGSDLVYMVGLPPGSSSGSLSDFEREQFTLGARQLQDLHERAVVTSPLPVIDEIGVEARLDPRVRMFEASDLGVLVRMALIEYVLGETPGR